jgi:signal transduction histidine kinase
MMLEPAQCAGDAPRSASHPSPTHLIRLLPPGPDACYRSEREFWLGRRRLERQLHDGAALRISALTLQIGLIRHRAPAADSGLDESIDALQDELHAVLQELRDVASKIYPPLLDEAGLGPALREVADGIATPVQVHASDDRFGPAAEGAAYYAVFERLDSLDPGTPPVDVVISRDGESRAGDERGAVLVVEITGVDVRHAGRMLEQVWRLGGTIDVTGRAGVGTITARIPCE